MTYTHTFTIAGAALAAIVVSGLVLSEPSPSPIIKGKSPQASVSASRAAAQQTSLEFPETTAEPVENVEVIAENQRKHDTLADANEAELRQEQDAARGDVLAQLPFAIQQDEASLKLGGEQLKALEAVRDQFQAAMQKAGDPGSAAYLERWLEQQERADQMLMAYLGAEEFNKLQAPEQ